MELFGIEFEYKNKPPLQGDFVPMHLWNRAYLSKAREPFTLAITGDKDRCIVYRTKIRNTTESLAADYFYVNRLLKTLLWTYGGYKVSVVGSPTMCAYLQETFSPYGPRKFDVGFMSEIYGIPFSVELLPTAPAPHPTPQFLGKHLNGYRIGFDAGGSDRKVVAVANGKVVYSEEVLWHPMTQEDPEYHYRAILDSMLAAAKKLPRIDAIGVSSAGIYLDNKLRKSSMFLSVPQEKFESHVVNIYERVAAAMSCQQLMVCNDGDVTALAGSMNLDAKSVLGISMSTSQATGFVDEKGNLTSWLNELCFAPVDASPDAAVDSWSGDRGCGVDYFSQAAVIRLAEQSGFRWEKDQDDAQKLRTVQIKMEQGSEVARKIFKTIGVYLGHTLALYHHIYNFRYVLLLGRVISGAGADVIFDSAQSVLATEYGEIADQIVISLPEENDRSVGQPVAAASLPEC